MQDFKPAVVVVIATLVALTHCQPTVIDFDYCAEGATLRQMARTLDILAQQTKSLSVTVRRLEEANREVLSKASVAKMKLKTGFTEWKSDLIDILDKSSTNLEAYVRREVNSLGSNVDQKLETVKQEVRESLLNQSDGISQLFSGIQNAIMNKAFEPADIIAKMTSAINSTMLRPFNSLLTSKMALIDQAHAATHRLESQVKQNIVSLKEILGGKIVSAHDRLERGIADTMSDLVNRLNDRSYNASSDVTIPGNRSLVDDVIDALDIYESRLKMDVEKTVGNISTGLRDKILQHLEGNREQIVSVLTDLDITGRLESIKQIVTVNELCPAKTVIESIRGATYVQEGSLRLVNGTQPMNGRVEVMYKGTWGTICDDGFGSEEAKVVCRQLGYCGGVTMVTAVFGRASNDLSIHLDDVVCSGREVNILECRNAGLGTHNCGHDEDVGVACSRCS